MEFDLKLDKKKFFGLKCGRRACDRNNCSAVLEGIAW